MGKKIDLDKYYTDLAQDCVIKTKQIIGAENITEWLEICIVIHKHKGKVIKCLDKVKWKDIVPPTTTPSLPQWQIYK